MSSRRSSKSTPAAALSAGIAHSGETVASVAEATGIPASALDGFLSGTNTIEVEALVKAGGFLHLSPVELLGVAA